MEEKKGSEKKSPTAAMGVSMSNWVSPPLDPTSFPLFHSGRGDEEGGVEIDLERP